MCFFKTHFKWISSICVWFLRFPGGSGAIYILQLLRLLHAWYIPQNKVLWHPWWHGTKLDQLRKAVVSCVYDVLAMVQTNLSDSELGISGYTICRSDRTGHTYLKILRVVRGGVLPVINSNIVSKPLPMVTDKLECLFVCIKFNHCCILIGETYIPSEMPSDMYTKFGILSSDLNFHETLVIEILTYLM